MPDFTEINRIVKHRYETGAYGSAHFRMTSSFWEAAKALPKPEAAPRLPWDPSPFASLLSIPIVIDDDLSGDEWRLVDTHTEEILYRSGLGGVLGGRVATLPPAPARWWLCPNTPPCPHGAVLHDVEDFGDPLPRCCSEGCPCGAQAKREEHLDG